MRRPNLLLPTVALTVSLLLAGCTSSDPDPVPPPNTDSPQRAATELAAALTDKNLKPVEFTGATGDTVDALFQPLIAGMGPVKPAVTVAGVDQGTNKNQATARLDLSWSFPGVAQPWKYSTTVTLRADDGRWKPAWVPSVVFSELNGGNRLSQRRLAPNRGDLRGEDGVDIVSLRSVYRIGIDKAAITDDETTSSARRLAELLEINPSDYAKRVAGAGKEAFVEAIVLRASGKSLPLASDVRDIPGGKTIPDRLMLAPNRDFARPLIGVVGDATKEVVDASKGTVVGGDQVGLSGLQKRYDAQLRGAPGVQVRLVAAKPAGSATASPSPTNPSPTSSATPSEVKPVTVFETKATDGKPLTTTIQPTLQSLAEKTLAKTKPAAALVARY